MAKFDLVEPVANELLVEARRIRSGLIFLSGPEAGGIGGQDFVAEDKCALGVFAKLKFRVRDNDALFRGVFSGTRIEFEGVLAEFVGEILSDAMFQLLDGDIFVVLAEFGLETVVYLADEAGRLVSETTVAGLLPASFGPKSLG